MPSPGIIKKISCLGGASIGPYTSAWKTIIEAGGGSLTAAEIAAFSAFEAADATNLLLDDRLVFPSMQNSYAAKVSFVNPSAAIATWVNSPTHTAGQGVQGDGTTSYINTNFNPFVDGVNFTLNNSSNFIYTRSNITETRMVMGVIGASSRIEIYPRYTGNLFLNSINSAGFGSLANSDSRGLFGNSRTGAVNKNFIVNGVSTPAADALIAIPNYNVFVLAGNNVGVASLFSNNQAAVYGAGSGNIDYALRYTNLQVLGTTLGWAV